MTSVPWRRPGGAPVLGPDGRAVVGPLLVLRPLRVRVVAWVCAVGTVVAFAVPAALLRRSHDGVYFRPADQVAVVMLGVLIGAGILLLTRPRVRADALGVEVRNVGAPRYLPWEAVAAVAFPDGASWARLALPYDEYLPVLAVQAVDGQRAVAAIRQLRALHTAAVHPAAVHTAAVHTADVRGADATAPRTVDAGAGPMPAEAPRDAAPDGAPPPRP